MIIPALFIQVLVILIVVGLLLWVAQQIPMDPAIARIIRVVVLVCLVLWLLYVLLGVLPVGSAQLRR